MALPNTPSIQSVIDQVNLQPGRNAVEKANAYLLSTRPSHASLPWAEQVRVAGEFSRELLAGKVPSGAVLASHQSGSQNVADVVRQINASRGRNAVERTNSYLCSIRPSHKALPWGDQVRVAGDFSRSLMSGQVPAI